MFKVNNENTRTTSLTSEMLAGKNHQLQTQTLQKETPRFRFSEYFKSNYLQRNTLMNHCHKKGK